MKLSKAAKRILLRLSEGKPIGWKCGIVPTLKTLKASGLINNDETLTDAGRQTADSIKREEAEAAQ